MRYRFLLTLLVLTSFVALGQIPKVPSQMEFAGMKLKITDAARAEMQRQVNSLRASDKYFKIKLDRVNLYFPIIERVFKEENLPDDFKYLVIQESALISDAVSSANAVGFWQFKDFTGREVGLRIDKQVDERMNIVSATRGAAKYMKTNNFYYKNWVYALMAYNTGRGGARKYVKEQLYGVSKMTIDKKTHWYVKTFLAHKIAFDGETGGPHSQGLQLQEYTKGAGSNIGQIASKFDIDKELVSFYNKWLRRGSIPSDKVYTVVLPVKEKIPGRKLTAKSNAPKKGTPKEEKETKPADKEPQKKYSRYLTEDLKYADVVYVTTNGIAGLLAKKGDDVKTLSEKAGVPESKFRKYNDLEPEHEVVPGAIYYRRAKKSKAAVGTHVFTANESLWEISQKYGVKLKKIRQYNRISADETPKAGTVLWLNKKMPKGMEAVVVPVDPKYVHQRGINVSKPVAATPKVVVNDQPNTAKTTKPTKLAPVKTKEQGTTKKEQEENKPTKVKIDPIVETINPVEKPKPALTVEETSSKEVTEKIEQLDFDIHEVEVGQTLYAIAKQYGVTVNDLIEWNNLDPYNTVIDIGQKLELKRPVVTPEKAEEIPTEKALYHEVQPGETAYAIARKYDITVDQLIGWNKLSEQAAISIGQKLKVSGVFVEQKVEEKKAIPKPDKQQEKAADQSQYHEVGPGDTLYSLSRKYNISVKDLIRINQKSDASIKIGERLKVKE